MARNPGPPPTATVCARGLDEHGAGVADVDGVRWHVPDLLPGEAAQVALAHKSPHRAEAWARLVSRTGPTAPERVPPACPAAGRCGGCAWQHLAYPAQLEHKRARVVDALAGLPVPSPGPVAAAPTQVGYRHRGKYVVASAGAGRLVLGGYAPRTHEVVDTAGCRIVAPLVDELAAWTRGAAQAAGLRAFDERSGRGDLRYVIVRVGLHQDALIALVTPRAVEDDRLRPVADALARHPAVRGVIALRHDRAGGAIAPREAEARVLFGQDTLEEPLAGVTVHVGVSEFLQVHRAQAQAMYARIGALAGATTGTRAVELYAGVGGIAFTLARAGAEVTAIERDGLAVDALRAAAQRAGLPITAIADDAAALARLAVRPDVLVVNPPRRGLADDAHAAILAARPPRLVYVSCGPESLARDLSRWLAAGYLVDAVEPFDLMPGTAQVEVVVRAQRVQM